jgi:hypothetical protein
MRAIPKRPGMRQSVPATKLSVARRPPPLSLLLVNKVVTDKETPFDEFGGCLSPNY